MAATPHNSKGCRAVNTGEGLSCFENSASVNVEWRNVTEGRSTAGNHARFFAFFCLYADLRGSAHISSLSALALGSMVPNMRCFTFGSLLFGLLMLAVAPLHAASVAALDGRVFTGESLSFDAKATSISIGGVTIALADCDWLEPGDGLGITLPGAAGKRLGVWLVDGSWLPAISIAAGTKDHELTVQGILGSLTLPLTAVRGWGTGVVMPGAEIKEDQVLLDSGLITGQVEGLIAGKLILRSALDPEPLQLVLDEVRGLRLAIAVRPSKGVRLIAALDDVHPPLRVVPSAQGLALGAAPHVLLGKSLDSMRLRMEGGRRIYLSEINPEKAEEVGAFGVVWPYQRDRNLDSSALRLGGVRYERGLAVHSQAYLSWKLDGQYTRLRALCGIADLVGDQGDCAASIRIDGKVVWTRDSVRGGEKPQPIDFDLTAAKQLELRVEYGARYDIADHFILADACLIKKP